MDSWYTYLSVIIGTMHLQCIIVLLHIAIVNFTMMSLRGCLSTLTLSILTFSRMTLSKVSFSDILRND